MEELHVVHVETRPGYWLHLMFKNGERRIFDMFPYLAKKPFQRLKDPALFSLAAVDKGAVVWPGNLDMTPTTLYARSKPA